MARLEREWNETCPFADNRAFVAMIDLRPIRYLFADDQQLIRKMLGNMKTGGLLEAVYLADFRHFHRMRMLIRLNELPYADLVFKYEADANEYLMNVMLSHIKKNNKDEKFVIRPCP